MKKLLPLLLATLGQCALANETLPNLPPDAVVARLLAGTPTVQAAGSQIQVEQANRERLIAGPYEWSLRLGGQQRKSNPATGQDERFNEWNAAIERPLRLPGKASLDGELGEAGVRLAEIAHGDALHETGRDLLRSWFDWLRENVAADQWRAQVALLGQQAAAIRRRQQLGDAAQLESIQGDAALAQAQAQLAQAEVRRQTAGESLKRRYPGLPLAVPASIAEPQAVSGSADEWITRIVEHNHELGVAHGQTEQARLLASRSDRDRLPDPTFGLHVSRERGGEENVVGAYINIPLPGGARRAGADAAQAAADAAAFRETAVQRKVSAEAANTYYAANAALATWQAGHEAAGRLERAAELTARAYQLGEGSLNDLLTARRMANEARLAAGTMRLDALEQRYRLLLDAHQLWDFDEADGPAN